MPKKQTSKADPGSLDDLSYEDAIGQLEAIVERIESGQIGLEESIAGYEQGVRLIAGCKAVLERAEQRIEELDATRLGESGGGSSPAPDRAD